MGEVAPTTRKIERFTQNARMHERKRTPETSNWLGVRPEAKISEVD